VAGHYHFHELLYLTIDVNNSEPMTERRSVLKLKLQLVAMNKVLNYEQNSRAQIGSL
jgi:hypothetical protein